MFFGLFSKKTKVAPEEEGKNANGKRTKRFDSSDYAINERSAKQAKINEPAPVTPSYNLSISLHSPAIREKPFSKPCFNAKESSFLRIATEQLKKPSKSWEAFVKSKTDFDLSTLNESERLRQSFCYQALAVETNYHHVIANSSVDSKLRELSNKILSRIEECFKHGLIDEILSTYAAYLGCNPEPADLISAMPHAYSCLLVETISNICRYTPIAHVDFESLSSFIRSFHKLSMLASLYRQIYTVQLPKISDTLATMVDSQKLLFSIFDWMKFAKISYESLKLYSDALIDYKMFTFWSVDYTHKITSKSTRRKVFMLVFMHGCIILDASVPTAMHALTKFSPLSAIQLTSHPDPKVQAGFCMKFADDGKIFLLEAIDSLVLDEFFKSFAGLKKQFEQIGYDAYQCHKSEAKVDSSQFTAHSLRNEYLEKSNAFLVDKQILAHQTTCKLFIYLPNENRWLNKHTVKAVYYTDEEFVPFINFCLEETGVVLYSLWLSKILKITEFDQSRLFIQTDSGKILLKFTNHALLSHMVQCIARLRGDCQEKGIFTSRPESKFSLNAYGNIQFNFYCYPVLLVGHEPGVLTISKENCLSLGRFGPSSAWSCSLGELELVSMEQNYVSQRHVLLKNKSSQEQLHCLCFRTREYAVEFCKTFNHIQEQLKLDAATNSLMDRLVIKPE